MDLEHQTAIKIRKLMTKALSDFDMLKEGDKVMMAVSGGKDSTIMSILMKEIQKKAPFHFDIVAVMLDQKQPGFNADNFKKFFLELEIELVVLEEDTYSIVKEKTAEGDTYCPLCSRMRRGILYSYAFQNNFTKIALGHHADDLIETLMLNMFYSGKLASMSPKLYSTDHRNIVIRPLSLVSEKDIVQLRDLWNFPVIPCNLCGSQENLSREKMKKLLDELETSIPDVRRSMLSAMMNIGTSHLLDKRLYDNNLSL